MKSTAIANIWNMRTLGNSWISLLIVSLLPSFAAGYYGIDIPSVHREQYPRNSSLIGPVRLYAPLHCGSDPSLVIPQTFYVQMHLGSSLQDHSTAIGKEIYPYVDWIPLWGERYRKAYHARSIDDELLEAILSDPMVEFVECDGFMGEQPGFVEDENDEEITIEIWEEYPD